MRRFSFLLPVMLVLSLPLSAQVKVNAVVLSDEETFTMQSATSGTSHVRTTVVVNNEDGLGQASFVLMTDSFMSLGAFSGEIVGPTGKKTRIKQKDLTTVSLSSGLADDSYVTHYVPTERYPFTVTYDYTVLYRKGIICFPEFSPVGDERVKVVKASYELDLPSGTRIISYASHVETVPERTEKGRVRYRWEVKDYAPLVEESLMPRIRESLPFVLAAPESFSYGGTTGTQGTWKEYGSWLYGLQEGADVLPAEQEALLKELTADCRTDLDRLKVLYAYLRDHTRYVSIQLGLGGLKPAPAAEVGKRGFGDCKALSNYLRAMLKAVGVPSFYYVIHTDRDDLFPGFSTVGQMNHAMLAVPLPALQDTVFVECTNPVYPLGYRHESTAGHQILLVKPEGGELVRVGRYPDSLSRRVRETEVRLATDGRAALKIRRTLYLDYVEPYLHFANQDAKERTRDLIRGMKFHPENVELLSVTDNFNAYAGRGYCPEMTFDYTLLTNLYGHPDGDRLFVPVNPISQGLSFQKSARINDLENRRADTREDRITVRIPDGFSVESLPPDAEMASDWGVFHSEVRAGDGCVTVYQRLVINRFREDKSRYGEYRDFARAVNRCYDASFVLKR